MKEVEKEEGKSGTKMEEKMTRSFKMAGFIVFLILASALLSLTPVQATPDQTAYRISAGVAAGFTHSVSSGRYVIDANTGKGCYVIGSKANRIAEQEADQTQTYQAPIYHAQTYHIQSYADARKIAEQEALARRMAELEAKARRIAARSRVSNQIEFEAPNSV
jgi:hypothetical protein